MLVFKIGLGQDLRLRGFQVDDLGLVTAQQLGVSLRKLFPEDLDILGVFSRRRRLGMSASLCWSTVADSL